MTVDRYPSRTGGPYSPPANGGFGLTVDHVRESTVREFGRVAEALRGLLAMSPNTVPNLWAEGALLTLASATTAPAAGVRGEFPVAVYGTAAERSGVVSLRVVVPGLYRLRLAWSTDAPGGGIVRWICRSSAIGSEPIPGQSLEFGESGVGAVGADRSISVRPSATNKAQWTNLGDLFIPDRVVVGVTVGRDPVVAPDTATADAFVLGVSLERWRDHA